MDTLARDEDDIEIVPMELPLDRHTLAWLARLHRVTGDAPAYLIASMLRMIRVDDETAHVADRRALN